MALRRDNMDVSHAEISSRLYGAKLGDIAFNWLSCPRPN